MDDLPLSRDRMIAALDSSASIQPEDDASEHAERFQHEGDGDLADDALLPPEREIGAAAIEGNAALDQNDTDNGRRLLNLFGNDFLNVREVGVHAWDGARWGLDGGDHALERLAQETARLMKQEAVYLNPSIEQRLAIAAAEPLKARAADDLSDAERETLKAGLDAESALRKRREGRRKFAISCGNRGRTVAMIAQALPHRTVTPADIDADPMRFNCLNGTLVFERKVSRVPDPECPDPEEDRLIDEIAVSVRLAPHDRGDRISKMCAADYRPEAKAPRFLAFMERFQPDPAARRFLQAAAGRALLGGASTQVLIFLYGDGANGKSVFMETLARLLGDYAGRLKPESITGTMEQSGDKASPDFARLQGKRFVAIAELPRGAPLREGLVKTMTGSEPMPVRHLNKGFFDMVPEFIPFMSGNQMPEIGGLDKGIWRRLKFVKWPVTLSDAEQRALPVVVGEFMEEAAGLLNWLVEGARIFLAEGLNDPPSVAALTQSHREDSDPIGAFLRDCVSPAEGIGVQARDMYRAFQRYCDANAIKPWGEKTFSMALKQKGYTREDKRIRVWVNVALHDVPKAERDEHPQPSRHDDPRR